MILNLSKIACITFMLAQIWTSPTKAQGFLRADGHNILNEKNENVLLRGIGLGGWMLQEGYMLKFGKEGQQYRIRERIAEIVGKTQSDNFYKAWLANHTRKADIDSLKAWGFNSVRLPMHFNLYTLPVDQEPAAGQQTWLEEGFAMTDSLLNWCKANQMYLILDLHAAPGGQGNDLNISDRDPSKPSLWESEANQQKTIALWKKLAERYATEPWIGAYDILNEPNWGFQDPAGDKNGTKEKGNGPLKKLMQEITAAIREVDQKHIVIIEGNGWGNNYNGILPPWDKNMVLSFHKYWSYNDPSSADHILKMREQYNIPVWIGETGENSNVWFTEAIRLFEKHNIGWAWWPLKKIGINNPMEIKSNPGYDALLRYTAGRGDKPSAEQTYAGLMKLAEDLKVENTVIHRDVIDAMMRQPRSAESKPFKKHVLGKSLLVNAVDYDLGRNGLAYFDKDTADYHVSTGKHTPGNRGGAYRNDGVDIEWSEDGYVVSNTESGEWLQYTIDVVASGNYVLTLDVAAKERIGELGFSIDGTLIAKGLKIPDTGGFGNFQTIKTNGFKLQKGKHQVRILIDAGGFNLRQLQFVKN